MMLVLPVQPFSVRGGVWSGWRRGEADKGGALSQQVLLLMMMMVMIMTTRIWMMMMMMMMTMMMLIIRQWDASLSEAAARDMIEDAAFNKATPRSLMIMIMIMIMMMMMMTR
jgi:hypothetical protein